MSLNRAFVFAGRCREALKEFGAFVTCRLGTLVLDAAIMMIFGNLLAAQGRSGGELYERCAEPAGWLVWPGYGAAHGHRRRSARSLHLRLPAAIAIIGGADGPTAIFVTSFYDAQTLWGTVVKVFSNVVVVVLVWCAQ